MTPPLTRRVPVDGAIAMAVDLWPGSGPAFLLVHGLASNAQLWWGTAQRLADLGHAVATVDQRGHGRSDKPGSGYTMDRACADLTALVDDLREDESGLGFGFGEDLIVAGQSWGANVALELGYRFPDVFSGVVCVDGGTIELSARFSDWDACARVMAPPRSEGRAYADVEAFMLQAHPTWPEAGVRAQLANFEVRPDATVAPWLSFEHHMQLLRALWEHRPSERYGAMKVPVLLVPADNGRTDFVRDKRTSIDAAVAALPRGRAHWFSPADHDLHAQFPVELGDLLHYEAAEGILS